MIIEVGEIIINKLKNLPFVDYYSGVVRPLNHKVEVSKGRFEKRSFPVSCETKFEDCEDKLKNLCPDSEKKSVLYLEDRGIRFIKNERSKLFFTASYDLICWLNLPKLGANECSYSASAIKGIIIAFPIVPFQIKNYQRIKIKIIGQQSKQTNPFSKYSYDEDKTQYLMYPYDFFSLQIDVDFVIDKSCLNFPEIKQPNC